MKTFSRIFIILNFCLSISISLSAQPFEKSDLKLTGNLSIDSKLVQQKFDEGLLKISRYEGAEKKSPIKSGLFSLIIPGAGQFYNGDIWQTVAFVAVEAVLITVAVIYNNKGNQKTDEFQNYANQHWDVKRYANWTLDHLSYLNSSLNRENYHVFDSNGNVIWDELNRLESDIGDGYSHMLYPFGEQQYYEMIGKYTQFSHGWDDSNYSDTDFHITSPRLEFYAGERGKANDLYNVSTKAVVGIYINHILSALEAAWGAARFNNNIAMNIRVEQMQFAYKTEFIPTMYIKFSF